MHRNINYAAVKPYGDHVDDGLIHLSFTLPIPYALAGQKAALQLAAKMGVVRPEVVHHQELTAGYSYFVVYGQCGHSVDYQSIQSQSFDIEYMSKEEVEEFLDRQIGREVVVVGAATGTDTHSVGIDAMLNVKGFNGHHGLEAYRGFRSYNLGSQVPNGTLVARAMEVGADASLVSQTVSQQKLHIHNLTQLVDIVEAQGMRKRVQLICGGPRISNELAKELGFDAGFSKGCYPNHLATYIVKELAARLVDPSEMGRTVGAEL
jgi:beta-lysine 5,6-aminomutase beta subunit